MALTPEEQRLVDRVVADCTKPIGAWGFSGFVPEQGTMQLVCTGSGDVAWAPRQLNHKCDYCGRISQGDPLCAGSGAPRSR